MEDLESDYKKETFLNWDAERIFQEEFKERLEGQFSYRYPYEKAGEMKLKFTVSELKRQNEEPEESGELLYKEEEQIPLLPKKLMEEGALRGAGRGTAYHKVLELLDFQKEYRKESLENELKEMERNEKISKEIYNTIWIWDILKFLSTRSAKRMHQAAALGRLHKEQPFVLGVDAQEIYPKEELAGMEELLLIQGIIDVWFEEEDGLVLLDYKTDRVTKGEELREKYRAQLEYYAQALERVTGKRVKEKIIYSFALQEEIIWH